MKVAILSESTADEAAVRILVDAVLGTPSEPIATYSLRTRGWPSVLSIVGKVLLDLYYRTDVEGFVVVVDSDDSLPHQPSHEKSPTHEESCRLCLLRDAVNEAHSRLAY